MLHIDLFPSLPAIPVNLQMHTQRNLIAMHNPSCMRSRCKLPAIYNFFLHFYTSGTTNLLLHPVYHSTAMVFYSAAALSHTTKTAPSIAFLAVVKNCSQAARRWHRIRTSHGVCPMRAKYAVMLMQPMNKERPMLHAMPIFYTSFKRGPRHPSHLTFS